jgi:hypothetical protein
MPLGRTARRCWAEGECWLHIFNVLAAAMTTFGQSARSHRILIAASTDPGSLSRSFRARRLPRVSPEGLAALNPVTGDAE